MKIKNKCQLFQWDINQRLTNLKGSYVDFIINKQVYRVKAENGEVLVPDELFQLAGKKLIYEAYEDGTYVEHVLTVLPRPMPPDYVYTPTEKMTFDGLVQMVTDVTADLERRADEGEFNGSYFFREGGATAAQVREKFSSGKMCYLIANDDTLFPLVTVESEYINGKLVKGVFFAKTFGYDDNISVIVKCIENNAGAIVSSYGFTGITRTQITSDMSDTNGKLPTDSAVRTYVNDYVRNRLDVKADINLENISEAGEQKIREVAGGGGVVIVSELPAATADNYGTFALLQGATDRLFFNMKKNGSFTWYEFAQGEGDNSAILGRAILGRMILGSN